METTSAPPRPTLDSQLIDYWIREAARLDTLAAEARFGWQRRRYLRKAQQARAQADRRRPHFYSENIYPADRFLRFV